MEGVYAALAIVGAVTGYGFSKAKKQSTKKYTLSADDIRVTTTAGAVVDGLFQNSPHKSQAYDCLLNKLPGWVKTKAAKTMELYNQSKASGAPPSVAYTNIRLGLLQDRELGNITASQELYFPKREQFYQWFKECIAAGPMGVQPVTPASARMPRSASQFTDRSASQFTDRSRSMSADWGGEESPVPFSLLDLATKRTILQRMGITDRATFGQWAETHRRTNPERVTEIEAIVNEVFPMTGWTPGSGTGLWRPTPIQVPATPAPTSETPLPTPTPAPTVTVPPPAPTVTVPPPAPTVTVPPPAPAPTQGPAPRISLPPQLPPAPAPVAEPAPAPVAEPAPAPVAEPAPAPTVTVPPPAPAPQPTTEVPSPEPGAGLGFETQPPTPAPTPTPVELPGPLPITTAPAPTPAPSVTVPTPAPTVTVPTPAPVQEEALREFLRNQRPPITDTQSFSQWVTQNQTKWDIVLDMFYKFRRAYPDLPVPSFPRPGQQRFWRSAPPAPAAQNLTEQQLREYLQNQTPSIRNSLDFEEWVRANQRKGWPLEVLYQMRRTYSRAYPTRAIMLLPVWGDLEPAPALDFEQVNPMLAPAPAPAVTQRQRPSLLSRLRRVTLRAPRGATKKQKDAKAALDQLAITNVDEFSTYIQGKTSAEQMDALQNGVVAYPDDADLFLDAMTADETAGTAFAQSSDALKKPIQKAADKARKKRPAALVTSPAAISAMTAAPPSVEEPPVELDQINPMFAPAPAPSVAVPTPTPTVLPPHMRGLLTPLPSAFVRETPAPSVPVPTPAPSVPVPTPAPLTVPAPPPEPGAGTGLGIVAPPPLPEQQGEAATPLPVSRLTRQQGTRQITPRRARAAADARKQSKQAVQLAASRIQIPEDFKNWVILYNQDTTYAEKKQVLLRLMDQYPTQAGDFWVSAMTSGPLGTTFRDDQDIRAKVLSLRQSQSQPSDELEDVLNAPTPTPASQASAATASSSEVWTPETAEPPTSIPAPPPGPPPATVPVPPGNLNSGQAKEWLATNLGVQNQQDFRRWMRENTSIVTDPILTTAEVAFPMGTLAGTTNFRTVYEALKSGKTVRATTQRRGGRKARKNTLRRRPGVNTKNVGRSSHRKNRANRRN